MSRQPYFAYGTTQKGFAHHRRFAQLLGDPVGRFRTEAPYAVVVPGRAACSNPGCQYVHRMALLVPGVEHVHAEGDLFLVDDAGLAEIDRLETSGPYVRESVAVTALDDGRSVVAHAYVAREPERWRALVRRGGAEALTRYPRELARDEALKDCCRRAPGHPPPHDVVDPLH